MVLIVNCELAVILLLVTAAAIVVVLLRRVTMVLAIMEGLAITEEDMEGMVVDVFAIIVLLLLTVSGVSVDVVATVGSEDTVDDCSM